MDTGVTWSVHSADLLERSMPILPWTKAKLWNLFISLIHLVPNISDLPFLVLLSYRTSMGGKKQSCQGIGQVSVLDSRLQWHYDSGAVSITNWR